MLRVLYAGSPYASALALNKLLESQEQCGFQIAGVLTNPPSARGRHKELVPTDVGLAVEQWNAQHGQSIPVFTPEHLDGQARQQVQAVNADILVCFAYGHIFGPKFLSLFSKGAVNLHPSLLPKYRGCTPVNAAILNRDTETGCSIQKISLACDEGDLLWSEKRPLDGTEDAESLLNEFAVSGGQALTSLLEQTAKNGQLPQAVPQSGEPSYCPMISKDDGKIDWKLSADEIDAKVRGYTPWPGCFTSFAGQTLKIIKSTTALKLGVSEQELLSSINNCSADGTLPQAECVPGKFLGMNRKYGVLICTGKGILVATELQLQGKKAMAYKDFMNGVRNIDGAVLE